MSSFFNFLSYAFHPVFVGVYWAAALLFLHPYYQGFFPTKAILSLLIQHIVYTIFIPLFTMNVLVRLKRISDLHARTIQERRLVYFVTIIPLVVLVYILRNILPSISSPYPVLVVTMLVSMTLLLLLSFLSKISAHTTALAAVTTQCAWIAYKTGIPVFYFILLVLIVLTGLVSSARLALKAHDNTEIFSGYLTGITAFLIAIML